MSQLRTAEDVRVGAPTHVAAPVVTPHALIADGDETSRDLRAAQLRDSGYRVSVSRTGFETIVKASCQIPDLILLDESVGAADVEDTVHLLSTCPTTAHIPIVRLRPGRRVPRTVLAAGARRSAAG